MSEEKKSRAETIRSAIEHEILSGKLPSGSQIEEQQLIERFGVSRTPAREALIQLSSAGLVTLVPRQGAIVSSISLRDYVAMSEILVQLEALAARLAARRMTTPERLALEAAFQSCATAATDGKSDAYRRANDEFHGILYDGSRNEILARQIRTMRARMRGMQDFRFEQPARVRASLEEHRAVLEAVSNGDENGAADAMVRHISAGGNVYADMIASMPGDSGAVRARKS